MRLNLAVLPSTAHRTRLLSFPESIRAWGPALLWAAVLFLLSAIPDAAGPSWLAVSDKVVHFGLYAVLGATLAFGGRRSGGGVGHGWLVAAGLLYGVTDEWHQMYVPGRSPELADWLADAAGVVAGYGTTWALLGRTTAGGGDPAIRDDADPMDDGS